MKKVLLLLMIAFSLGVCAQDYAYSAMVNGNKASLDQTLTQNYIEIVLPTEVSQSDVNRIADYYTDEFTVSYNPLSRIARFDFVNSGFYVRRVVGRFLFSSNIGHIDFNGKSYDVMTFMDKFMK